MKNTKFFSRRYFSRIIKSEVRMFFNIYNCRSTTGWYWVAGLTLVRSHCFILIVLNLLFNSRNFWFRNGLLNGNSLHDILGLFGLHGLHLILLLLLLLLLLLVILNSEMFPGCYRSGGGSGS